MTGSSIFDYVHHQDHTEVAEQFGLSLSSGQGLASPSSGASDEGGGNHGTNNPDGKFFLIFSWFFPTLCSGVLLLRIAYFGFGRCQTKVNWVNQSVNQDVRRQQIDYDQTTNRLKEVKRNGCFSINSSSFAFV